MKKHKTVAESELNKEIQSITEAHEEVTKRLSRLSTKPIVGFNDDKPMLEPVSVLLPTGQKLYMERIIGSTKYFSHNKKIVYDMAFADLYYHDNKIPDDHVVVINYLLKIEAQASIDHPIEYLKVLDRTVPATMGTCFYLDDKLYQKDVKFRKADPLRDYLLRARRDGSMYFRVLKIVDGSGNVTEFH